MKQFGKLFLVLALIVPTLVFGQSDIETKLKQVPGVKKLTKIENQNHFAENYELWFEQLTDPSDSNSQKFLQLVYVGHVKKNKPVIVELQGYNARSSKSGELATLFNCNQIKIEHRYFANSKPETGIPWKTLTVANAAYDQHVIINALKEAIYPKSKFLSTGISKGGQTTMIHRSKYPEDVDASVCYVAPLNFEREDKRIYKFLNSVGTEAERKQVRDFQLLCFERKEALLPMLDSMAIAKKWSWEFSTEKAFEYYVLEYSFAFWQWGAVSFGQIPTENASDSEVLNHVLNTSGVSFFENHGVEPMQPFFYAAMTEMGMYGYENEPFKEYLSQQSEYTFEFSFPEGENAPFSSASMLDVNDFIQKEAEQMMFIYGEVDTWSATAVELTEEAKSRGLKKYVFPRGNHGTRIHSFDEKTQKEIRKTLKKWL